jgi:multidrug efflux system membrane fusion protein
LLAEIDPRPFQAQLVQFQGQLQRDQAQLIAAQQDLKRYANLYPIGAVSRQTYDTQKQLVQQLQGTIQSDQGQIDQVKVNLIYTKIISPIDGQIGLRQVDPGNFVQPGDTNGLVVVNTMQPIAVLFTLPEDDIARVQAQVNAGKTLRVEAYDRAQNTVIAVGSLLTLDNQIDVTTGTVKVKANFSNSEKNLFPHQFVNVKLLLQTLPQALVVPTPAIQYGPQGTFVYVLQQDQTVQVRPVTVGETVADNTVINSGLKLGESVIVEGVDKLTNGAKVEVAQANPLPAPVIPARLSVHLRAGK